MDILIVLFLIISLVLLFWQISNFVSVFFGSPYVIMDRDVIRHALKQVDIKKNDIFYDLGCGNGDVLIEASKYNIKAVGFEISPFYFLIAKLKILLFNINLYPFKCSSIYSGINIRYRNIFNVNLRKVDIIYCYLLPKLLDKLSPKFLKELKPNARVISIGFPIPKLKLAKKVQYRNHKIFIYSPISRSA